MYTKDDFKPCHLFFRFDTNERLNNFRKNGYMYLKNLNFFINLEKESKEKGKGDINEARACVIENIKIYDKSNNKIIGHFKDSATLRVTDTTQPIYCMTVKNIFENITELDFPYFKSTINFDKKMLDDFCKNCKNPQVLVIHNIDKFLDRVEFALSKMNLSFKYRVVEYSDTSIANEVDGELKFNGPFNKDSYFSYQSEFRILVETSVDDFLDFSIGNIEDISTLIPVYDLINGIELTGTAILNN